MKNSLKVDRSIRHRPSEAEMFFFWTIFLRVCSLNTYKFGCLCRDKAFFEGKHRGLPGGDSAGMWVQIPRPCSVKIAQPWSLWFWCRITLAIIIKDCMYQGGRKKWHLQVRIKWVWGERKLSENPNDITNTKLSSKSRLYLNCGQRICWKWWTVMTVCV